MSNLSLPPLGGNSDAGIDVAKQNAFNFYKDKLRTFELLARQRLNQGAKAPEASAKKSPVRKRKGEKTRR